MLRDVLGEGVGQIVGDLVHHLKNRQLDAVIDSKLLKNFIPEREKIRDTFFFIWLQIASRWTRNRNNTTTIKETELKAAVIIQVKDDRNLNKTCAVCREYVRKWCAYPFNEYLLSMQRAAGTFMDTGNNSEQSKQTSLPS